MGTKFNSAQVEEHLVIISKAPQSRERIYKEKKSRSKD
jgi:hypothetical protein